MEGWTSVFSPMWFGVIFLAVVHCSGDSLIERARSFRFPHKLIYTMGKDTPSRLRKKIIRKSALLFLFFFCRCEWKVIHCQLRMYVWFTRGLGLQAPCLIGAGMLAFCCRGDQTSAWTRQHPSPTHLQGTTYYLLLFFCVIRLTESRGECRRVNVVRYRAKIILSGLAIALLLPLRWARELKRNVLSQCVVFRSCLAGLIAHGGITLPWYYPLVSHNKAVSSMCFLFDRWGECKDGVGGWGCFAVCYVDFRAISAMLCNLLPREKEKRSRSNFGRCVFERREVFLVSCMGVKSCTGVGREFYEIVTRLVPNIFVF